MTPNTQHAIDREIRAARQAHLKKVGDTKGEAAMYAKQKAAVMAMLAQEVYA